MKEMIVIWGKGAAVEQNLINIGDWICKEGKRNEGSDGMEMFMCYISEIEAKEGETPRGGSRGQKDTDKWREKDKQ